MQSALTSIISCIKYIIRTESKLTNNSIIIRDVESFARDVVPIITYSLIGVKNNLNKWAKPDPIFLKVFIHRFGEPLYDRFLPL